MSTIIRRFNQWFCSLSSHRSELLKHSGAGRIWVECPHCLYQSPGITIKETSHGY